MKFVLTQSLCQQGMKRLQEIGELFVADSPNPDAFIDELRTADALIVRIGKLTADQIKRAPNLNVIGRTGVGYDCIDVQAATALGIPVVITPGANSRSVAEHTLAMILSLAHQIVPGHEGVLSGDFLHVRDNKRKFEIFGKTVGVVGYGSIGRIVSDLCAAVGMRVAVYDTNELKMQSVKLGYIRCSSLEDLLDISDFVTLHAPMSAQNENMIGRRELSLMKPTACLINCARGGLVDEAALSDALGSGALFAAATDVFTTEPPSPDNPLLSAKNMLYSPHNAAQTTQAILNMANSCIDGCLAVLQGKRWPHVADPLVYTHSRFQTK